MLDVRRGRFVSDARACHLLARFGTFAARLSALHHHCVPACNLLARFGALAADLSALPTDVPRVVRAPRHEARGSSADGCAILHDPLMLGAGVVFTHVKTMVGALSADKGALAATLHAGEHFFGRHFVGQGVFLS